MIMGESNPVTTIIWSLLASLAGAVTALSYRPFQHMTKCEISIAIIVGTSFAIFVGPLVALLMFRGNQPDMRIMGGVLYLMASGSNILIPLGVRKISTFFGGKNETERKN